MWWPWDRRRPALDQRVARALERGGVLVDEITITADRGRVTLRGPVPSAMTRERACALARAVDGVRAVSDLLVVVEPPERAAAIVSERSRGTVYVVQPGDTLDGIALELLGTRRRWRDLLRINEQVIGDPCCLQPGLRIRLPQR